MGETVSAWAARPLPGPWLERVAALRGPHRFWLDSALEAPALGRLSFAGADPYARVRAFGRRVVADVLRAADPRLAPGRRTIPDADPLEVLRSLLPPAPRQAGPRVPFGAGAVGVLGYELAAQMDPTPVAGRDDLGFPDLDFLLVDRVLVWDHARGRGLAVGLGVADAPASARRRAVAAAESLALASAGPADAALLRPAFAAEEVAAALDGAAPEGSEATSDAAGHAAAVRHVLERIACGDLYQACLTHRLRVPFAGDPLRLHGALRTLSPAPFAAFLELGDATVVGSSPERFLRVAPDGCVESRPIKGTRPRRTDPAADRAEARALRRSPKDRAENLMIVDLVRNDLGRVCATGSVRVPALHAVESYATVHHLVSTVRGRLAPGRDLFDAVRAAFPPGSMTGAPKLAAMALLAELEPVRRGFYAGALGWIDVRGACDLSVVIRSAFLAGGHAALHTGGGIVADSAPEAEWREAREKVRALLAALRLAVS